MTMTTVLIDWYFRNSLDINLTLAMIAGIEIGMILIELGMILKITHTKKSFRGENE